MDLTFSLFDFVELAIMFAGVVGAYWKLSQRVSLAELTVMNIEKDVIENKREYTHRIETMEGKLEKRLSSIDGRIEQLIKEVAKLTGKI